MILRKEIEAKMKRKNYRVLRDGHDPYKDRKKSDNIEAVQASFVEVELSEVNGDTKALIKRFSKKCRKEDVLRPYLDRRYHKTKSQKRREKHQKAVYEQKKQKD